MSSNSKRTALITGSTSGIGLAIARALAGQGHAIMLHGFGDAETISHLKANMESEFQVEVHTDSTDLRDEAGIRALVAQVIDSFGSLDILVNNAGIQHVDLIEDFPAEYWNAILAVDLSAAFHTTKAVLPSMKKAKWGRIINIASAHALVASPGKAAYVAAKHGIAGFTKVTALETARFGITANAIAPGYAWTPLVEKQVPEIMQARGMSREDVINNVILSAHATKEFILPEDIASLVVYLTTDAAKGITGSVLSIDGGWTAA
jgi:3-hydroxybutyrate dehydrogenase